MLQSRNQRFVAVFFVAVIILVICLRFLSSGPKYISSNGEFTLTITGQNKVVLSGNVPGAGICSGTGTLNNGDHVHVVITNTASGKPVEVFGVVSDSGFKGMYQSSGIIETF